MLVVTCAEHSRLRQRVAQTHANMMPHTTSSAIPHTIAWIARLRSLPSSGFVGATAASTLANHESATSTRGVPPIVSTLPCLQAASV